ncbi:TPA: hypothetical protein ACV5T4_000988 [Salmonella enterica]
MSSREKFEQAIKARFGDQIDYRVCKNSDGEYMAWDMQVAWWAWQAAETELAVQLANAESKCRELAAENAALKLAAKKVIKMNRQHAKDQYGDPNVAESWGCVKALRKAKSETPATDAYLAEVRAQGVEMFAAHKRERQQALRSRSMRMSEEAAGMAADAENFADELRKGVQS